MSSLELQIIRHGRYADRITIQQLAEGERGTWETLDPMARIVREDVKSESVKRLVVSILDYPLPHRDGHRVARAHDAEDEVEHLFIFWRDAVRWTRDSRGIERIADLESTLALRPVIWGDCGSKTIGLATSLGCLGYTPYFVVIAQTPQERGQFTFNHVYVGLMESGKHTAYDPTPQDKPLYWEARAMVKVGYRIWPDKDHLTGKLKPQTWLLPN